MQMTPSTEKTLRQAFKRMNQFMVLMWRLGFGWAMGRRELSGQIMVLVHRGRKSGLVRRTPVNYAIVDGEVYCVAGFGQVSDWYRNITANPHVEVWLPNGWWAGTAEDISGSPDRVRLIREVMIASGFAAQAAGIDPVHMRDDELEQATHAYPLFHIRREAACTGPGGPGELAWVWQVSTFVLLAWLFVRRR